MTDNLFVHPHTETSLLAMAKNIPHALLLSGPKGIGLHSLSHFVVSRAKLKAKAQIIEPDEKHTISIDTIRELYKSTRTKQDTRIIIIRDADRMTVAAQNAFLKLLEEPSANLNFLLTSHAPMKLLPTILSRVQHIAAQPITTRQTEQLLDTLQISDTARRNQLRFIANGLPAELHRLASDEAYFASFAQLIRDARELLQSTMYSRALLVNKYSSDREKALQFIGAIMQIIHMSLLNKPQESTLAQLEKLLVAEDRIRENGHVRTQLLRAIW